jgi:hypothetical protein
VTGVQTCALPISVTLVAGLDGVKGVNNLLTWQKSPR